MRRHAAIFTLGCVFLAGCQSAHSTPAPTAKPVTVTVTTTATRTVTVSVTPSVSAAVSTTTVPRTQEADSSLEDSEPYDGYSYEDDYEDDYDSGVGGYYRSEPKLFMHRNPGNNVVPKIPSQKRYNSTPNHSGGSKNNGGTGSSSGKSSSGTGSGSGRSSSGGGGSRRR
jgi:lipoprotein